MKKYNQIILIVLCIFTLFSSFGSNVLAQPAIPSLSKPSSIILNSQPEVYVKNIVLDSKTYKAGDTVKGSFTLLNNKAQPVSDVYYKISLAGDYQKNNLAKTFYDSVKNGPLSLAGRESKKIDFTYVLPKAVAGDNLGIQVSALLGSGMPMGWGDSMIKVEGEMSLLKVVKAVISINNNKFDFQTGTAVSREDEAFLEVNLINPTKNNIEIIPKVKIYNNITPAISSELNLNTVTIPAYSSSSIKYELPKFENKVGVYVGNLSFFDANGNKRALDLQFNYRIPELNNATNTDVSQNGVSTGKVYTTRDYIFFVGLILLGLGLIGLIVFLVIKLKKKIVLFSFLTFLLLGGVFGLQEVSAGCYDNPAAVCGTANNTCVSGTPDRYMENGMQSTWYCNGMAFCESSCKFPGDCPIEVLCYPSLPVGTRCVDETLYVSPTLRVKPTDEGVMNWYSATNACSARGAGWRLPTKPEFLDVIDEGQQSIYYNYPNRAVLGFGAYLYWTSTEYSGGENDWSEAWYHSFIKSIGNDTNHKRNQTNHVRCIKTVAAGSDCLGKVLNITKGGNGSGTVTSNVGGISCGTTCSTSYASGTNVTLTATPSAGSNFTGWSGACTGTGTCTVTMNAEKTLTANFTLFSGGDGSVTNPYKISTCTELQAVKNYLTSNFILINDIDCSDTVNWNGGDGFLPIGGYIYASPIYAYPFSGIFNGNNYTISNLYINRGYPSAIGLFTFVTGKIGNLGLINANVNNRLNNYQSIGIFASVLSVGGTICNSYSTGNVTTSQYYAGGLAGSNYGTINNSYSTARVSGSHYNGGLVGTNQPSGIVSNSYSVGNVTSSYVGSLYGNLPLAGGLFGVSFATSSPSSAYNSYWDVNTSGRPNMCGANSFGYCMDSYGKTTAEMQSSTPFGGWDTNIWTFTQGQYPKLKSQNNCLVDILSPSNVIISTPSCSGLTVHFSWSDVIGAAQYKIYKDNTFLATTTATSSDIGNISTSTVLSVSAISATGVESATSTSVSVPAGIKPKLTNPSFNNVKLYNDSMGQDELVTTNVTPGQDLYLRGIATAENGLSQYLKMNYYTKTTDTSSSTLSGPAIFSEKISFGSSTAILGGQFNVGPFKAPSTSGSYDFSYSISAYPYCVVDYSEASTTLIMNPENSIPYTIPSSASCGSANDGTSQNFPAGTDACINGNVDMTSGLLVLDTGPWNWNCIGVNNTATGCNATKTPLTPSTALNCSFLPTPATNQLNTTVVLTATTTPACPSCTKKWTLIDNNNLAPGKDITGGDNTSYTLSNIFTTVGLKTITAQVFSADGLFYGNTCTTTTNIIQGESITKEI